MNGKEDKRSVGDNIIGERNKVVRRSLNEDKWAGIIKKILHFCGLVFRGEHLKRYLIIKMALLSSTYVFMCFDSLCFGFPKSSRRF